MSNTLGIDQSYTSCALCVTDAKGDVVAFSRFKSNAEKDTYARALEVALFISDFVTMHTPSQIKIEGLAFGIRGNATRDLAGLLFTIINVLSLKNPTVAVSTVAPTQVKKRATGTGKADKSQMINSLPEAVRSEFEEARFKKTTGLSDLADAYWISLT